METIRFDQSLDAFASILAETLGEDVLKAGTLLRNASGHLAFIADTELPDETARQAEQALAQRLSAYCRNGRVVLTPHLPGVAALSSHGRIYLEEVTTPRGRFPIRVMEQRIVGQDWLQTPAPSVAPPAAPRIVFASLKGGVGRSTALAVVAANLARCGRKVLVVDLDLEAPGIGTMLLAP